MGSNWTENGRNFAKETCKELENPETLVWWFAPRPKHEFESYKEEVQLQQG